MAVIVRDAKLGDAWELIELIFEFKQHLIKLGAKTINRNPQVLKSGVALEVGSTFRNDNWKYIVAEREGTLIGFLIGQIERCAPTDEYESCLRIMGDYLTSKSMGNARILQKMWDRLISWGVKKGVGYTFGMIHPGNQPAIKVAKAVNFKHHMTQFLRLEGD